MADDDDRGDGTYYRSLTLEALAKSAGEAPNGSVFSLKAPCFSANRNALGECGGSIQRFVVSGIAELGDRLRADPHAVHADEAFQLQGLHGVCQVCCRKRQAASIFVAQFEVRQESFLDADFGSLARFHGTAIAPAAPANHPKIAGARAHFEPASDRCR